MTARSKRPATLPAKLLALPAALMLAGAAFAQVDPRSPTTGMAQPPADDPVEALGRYLRVLATMPRNLDALKGAGRAALAIGDANAAISFFARAEAITPRDGWIKSGLAAALVQMEQPKTALKLFGEAVALGVPEAELAGDRGLAYDLRGDNRRAQQDYALALRSAPDDETTRRLALSQAISGDRTGAMATLDALLRRQDRAAWRVRAFVLALTGDRAGAEQTAMQVMPAMQAQALIPFLGRLAVLQPSEKAAAVHLGQFPVEGQTQRRPDAFANARPIVQAPPSTPAAAAPRSDVPLIPAGTSLAARTPATSFPAMPTAPRRRPDRTELASAAPLRARAEVPAYSRPIVTTPTAAAVVPPSVPATGTGGPVQSLAASPVAAPDRLTPTPWASTSTSIAPAAASPPPRTFAAIDQSPAPAPGAAFAAAAAVPVRPRPVDIPASNAADFRNPAPALAAQPDQPPVRPAQPNVAVRPATPPPVTRPVREQSARVSDKLPAAKAKPADKAATTLTAKDKASSAKAKLAAKDGKSAAEKESREQLASIDRKLTGKERKAKDSADKNGRSRDEPSAKSAKADPKGSKGAKNSKDAKAVKEADDSKDAKKEGAGGADRYWVQVASGANKGDLGKAWERTKAKAPKLLGSRATWTSPWRESNRLLVGPFKSDDEAQGFVNSLSKVGLDGMQFTSRGGTKVERLGK